MYKKGILSKNIMQMLVVFLGITMYCQKAFGSIIMQHIDTQYISLYCMFKDSDGLLWAGTSRGLMSYPQLLSAAPTDYRRPHELSTIINQIRQDNLGRLWLRTQANHALIYNPHTNELISNVEQYLQNLGLRLWYEFLLETDDHKRVWFYKDNVITVKDFKTGQYWTKTLPSSAGRIIDMSFHRGRMYIITEHRLFTASLNGRQLLACAIASTTQTVAYDRTYMFVDRSGNVWLKSNGLLIRFDTCRHVWSSYPEVLPDITSITQDNLGNIIVASTNHGIYLFHPNGTLAEHIVQSLPIINGLSNNHIQCAYYDNVSKSILIAYHKTGMSLVYPPSSSYQFLYIQDSRRQYVPDDVISMADAGHGSFWAGTEDNGIYLINSQGDVECNLFPGQTATAVMKDSSGKIWAGLYQYGLLSEDGHRFFAGKSPFNIIELSPGRLFVNLNGEGLYVLDTHSEKITPIPTDNKWIMDVGQYRRKIFAATPLALYIIDKKTLAIRKVDAHHFSPDFANGIKAILVDHRGWVWMVNYMLNSPVEIYDYLHNRVIDVTELNKYSLQSMTEDHKGNIWCATDKGLIRVSISGGTHPRFHIISFGKTAKTVGNERAAITLSNGQQLFGTISGIIRLTPSTFLSDFVHGKRDEEPLKLSLLRINNRTISPGDSIGGRVISQGDICYLKNLNLSYDENNLVLQFQPNSISLDREQVWSYMLEGMDKAFMPLNNNNTVIISNLPPGTYHLMLRYKTTGRPYNVLTIHIAPPFYRSALAYVVYMILLVLIGWSVYNRQKIRMRMFRMRLKAEQEKKLNDMKFDFFTNMSHELRTPLTLIASPLEELLKKPMDQEMHSTLSLIYRNTQRLTSLIKKILDVRKNDMTDEEFHPQSADLSEYVGKICSLYTLQAKLRHIDFVFNGKKGQRFVEFDLHEMEMIVNNLLSNAFKYTPDGGSIRVSVLYQQEGTVIEVADTGVGIDDKEKEKIFDRYYRTGMHLDDRHSTGIGLDVVQRYVRLHKGTIHVTDNQPCGSIFRVWLPYSTVSQDTAQSDAAMATTAGDAREHSHTLLVVEDNIEMLGYLSTQLGCDYRVLQATNGNGAMEILRKGDTIDVVISDVMMQGMDGLTLTKTIKSDISLSHIPVILLTAKALDDDELRGLQMGANDYITKPFNLDVLRMRVRLQLEKRENIRHNIEKAVELKPADVAVTTLDEEFMQKVMDSIEKNMSNADYSVDDLSNEVGLHRTNVYKKIQFLTGKTPLMFIRLMRLKRARQLMSKGDVMVSQIAYQVGFNNPKIFSRYFKEQYGIYPSEYIKQQEGNKDNTK